MTSSDLPLPTPEAAAVSARLERLVRDEISQAGGWIPFSRFMELALYAPGLGYYSAGAAKIGRHPGDGSDFVTAPELTPLFARTLARPVGDLLAAGDGSVLEIGGGTGALAAGLLLALEADGRLPVRYEILEVSADLRARQQARLRSDAPHLLDRVRWRDEWPDRISGVIVGNEVLDALPVDLVVATTEGWLERGVVAGEHALAFEDRKARRDVARDAEAIVAAASLPHPYLTERHRAMDAFVASLVDRMDDDAAMLMIDYGFPASEYFHPQRSSGTVMAHYRHRSNADVLDRIGLQDITTHVDFSAVARTARAHGGTILGYTSQAHFLIGCGIAGRVAAGPTDPAIWARQAQELQTLLSEAEMGELFKVIAIAKQPREVVGFGRSDRQESL